MDTSTPARVAVWFEIPVTDMARAKDFYGDVLQTQFEDENDGPNPMAVFAGGSDSAVKGHLYPGKPAPAGVGPTVHLGVAEPLEEALGRVTAKGGSVVSPVISIPAGRFAYCVDPDGNSFGLFV